MLAVDEIIRTAVREHDFGSGTVELVMKWPPGLTVSLQTRRVAQKPSPAFILK